MSDILNAKPAKTVTKPTSVKEIKKDIAGKEAKADFTRTNIFKWVVLILTTIVLVCVTMLFLYKLFNDMVIQNYVIDQIKNNIVFIMISGLAIVKINIPRD